MPDNMRLIALCLQNVLVVLAGASAVATQQLLGCE